MKLLYLTGSPIPSTVANSVHAMCMAQAFAENGFETTLVARRCRELSAPDDEYAFYGVKPCFRVIKLTRLKGLGVLYSRAAARLVGSTGPDVVYGRDLLGVYLAARRGLPAIFESHGPLTGFFSRMILKRLARLKNLKRIVVISEALKRIMLEAHPQVLHENMLLVAHDGVDLERFAAMPDRLAARAGLGIPGSAFVAGYFGHLYRGRGAEQIVEVARSLPDVSFMLVGGRPGDIERLRPAAAGLENIRFWGHVPRGQLLPYWAACDVLLMPYQRAVAVDGGGNTALWMSPMKMFEYMATGRPIISSDLPVLGEVLTDRRNALLVPPESPAAWSQAIEKLQQQPEEARGLAARARRDVEAYAWNARVRRVMEGIP